MSNMKKMVLELVIEDEKSKRKAMKAIEGVEGVKYVIVDMKEKQITVIGEVDPVFLIVKLRKVGFGYTELVSVGPAHPQQVYANPSSYEPYAPYYTYTVAEDDYNPSCSTC